LRIAFKGKAFAHVWRAFRDLARRTTGKGGGRVAGPSILCPDDVLVFRATLETQAGGEHVVAMVARAFDNCRLHRRYVTGSARHGDRPAAADGPVRGTLENVKLDTDQKVVCSVSRAISGLGEFVGLQDSPASEDATVKVAGMPPLRSPDPARGFDCGGNRRCVAVHNRGGRVARFPKIIAIGAGKSTLRIELSEAHSRGRREAWKVSANPYQSGRPANHADRVGPARKGVVVHSGGRADVVG
jgi:hypothetical protein